MKKLLLLMILCVTLFSCKFGVKKGDSSKELFNDFVELEKDKTGFAYDISVSKYEVSRAWLKSVGITDVSVDYPNTHSEGDARPADGITKETAIKFCNALSVKEKLTPYYNEDGTIAGGNGYRLLTKAEWEACAKAGTENIFSGTNGGYEGKGKTNGSVSFKLPILENDGTITNVDMSAAYQNVGDEELSKYAWNKYNVRTGNVDLVPQPRDLFAAAAWELYEYNGCVYKQNSYGYPAVRGGLDDSQYGTRKVGTKLPNEFGLYDMTGNVSELVEEGSFIGGDIASNTSKIYIGHSTYDAKIKGFRICKTK